MKTYLNGINLYYEIHGEGEPLVLIAGLTAHSGSWPNQLPEFAKHYQVIMLDNRNSGRSDIDNINYNVKTMAEDVIALLDHLQISSAHILGRSMGGYIAQEIAINHPSYVNKLILSVSIPVSSISKNLLFDHFLNLKDPSFDQRLFWKELIFWENSPLLLKDAETLEEAVTGCLANPYMQSYEGFKNQIRAIQEHNSEDRLQLIKSPTLVVTGEQDLLTPPKETQALANKISNARWECLPKAGHAVHDDQAKLFNELVLEFLND